MNMKAQSTVTDKEFSMDARTDLSACANPECSSKFVRFGDGELYVFHVADPQAWGLPSHAKQKVFWLCEKCSPGFFVRLDRRNHSAQVVSRRQFTHGAA
jgi:hypothetical protein